MAAACAACLAPIATGERFVLSGTEVFHRTCARGINRSQRTRLELRVAELERELAQARSTITRDRGAVEAKDKIAERAKRDLVAKDQDLQRARAARDAALRDSTYWQELRAVDRRELERLQAALGSARIAEQRAPVPPPPQASEPAPVAKDDRDDTEIRFSLLELDKT